MNMNPCLEFSCSMLSRVIGNLIEQVFRIAVDPLFPPPKEWPKFRRNLAPDNIMVNN